MQPSMEASKNLLSSRQRSIVRLAALGFTSLLLLGLVSLAFGGVSPTALRKLGISEQSQVGRLIGKIAPRTSQPKHHASAATSSFAVKPAAPFAAYTVNSLADTNTGSGTSGTLRYCITQANSSGGSDTISFSVTGTINLSSKLPTISGTLTISGPGADQLTINGGNYTLMDVGNSSSLTMSGLRMTGGNTSSGLNASQLDVGGGSAALSNCSFENTLGGLCAIASFVSLTMTNCLINNSSNNGLTNGGTATLTNVTITDCLSRGIEESSAAVASTTLVNCTIAANGTGFVVNLRVGETHSLTLKNTIIANNSASQISIANSGGPALTLTSQGYNLCSDNSLTPTTTGDLTNTNPRLGTLGDYGGTTNTLPLLPGSPAINAGTASGAPTTDQRGLTRVGTTDIGAFESRGFSLSVASGNNQSTAASTAFGSPLAVTVSNANSEPVDGGIVTFTAPGSGATCTIAGNPATISGGVATTGTVTANSTVGGPYTVTASALGATSGVNFSLTNNTPSTTVSSINRASSNPTCINSSVSWTVTFAASVTGVSTSNFSLVGGTGASITGVSGSGTTWTVTANTGTAAATLGLNMVNSTGVSPSVSGLTFTGQTYTVNASPTTANAGPDQTLCTTAPATLAANTPSVGTGAWTVVSGPSTSTAQFSSTSSPTATFTPAGGAGTYTLRWTISNSPCAASTNDVVLTYNAPPTTANAGPDQTLCTTAPATLAANTPSVGTGAWTVVSGPSTSTAQFSSTSSPTATFTPAGGAGTYTLRWTISNSPCNASTNDVVLTYNAPPTTANAGPDQTVCATSATLAANAPSVGTGAWTIISGTGGSVSTPASPTSTFTGTAGTSYTLRWTISNSPCTASTDDVVINLTANPTTANAGSDQTVCTTAVNLAANAPTVGTGAWTIISGTGGSLVAPSSRTSAFIGTAGTSYTLRWTISNSPCTASTDDVMITFNAVPMINLGTSPSVFSGVTNASLPYTATTGSPDQYSIDYNPAANTAGFVDVTNATLGSSPIGLVVPGAAAPGTYNATLTVRNSTTGCVSSATAFTVTITACVTSLTVNNTGDGADATPGNGVCETATGNGICTLRAAIQEANALTACSPFTINFSVNGTITLGSALPVIGHPNLTITGNGSANTVISGNNTVAGLSVTAASRTLALNDLTITNANSTANGAALSFTGNSGTLTLTNCVLSNSTTTNKGGGLHLTGTGTTATLTNTTVSNNTASSYGGGIEVASATLTLNSCTFTGNTGNGGGIAVNFNASTLNVNNSLFSNNTTTGVVGGALGSTNGSNGTTSVNLAGCTFTGNSGNGAVTIGDGLMTITNSTFTGNPHVALIAFDGTVTIVNSTFSGNTAPVGTAADIYAPGSPTVNLKNTILANAVSGAQCAKHSAATVNAENSLIEGSLSCVSGTNLNNLTGDPLLSVLGSYGGLTQTFALLPGSPAINAGTSTDAPTTDQRGSSRVGNVDIGAFESQGFTLTSASGNGQSTNVNTAFGQQLKVNVTSSNNEPVDGGQITYTPVPSGGGASCTITGSPATLASGMAQTASVTANGTAGAYTVTASANGATAPLSFNLTNNTPVTVSSINRASGTQACANASVDWTVTFSASVTGVTASNFALVGGTGASLTGVSGSGTTWTVTANTGTAAATLGLNMVNSTGVSPSVSGLTFTGQTYTVNAAPTTANAGPDQTLCTTAPATLAANTPSVGTGAWTIVSGPSTSTAQFSSTSSPTATFTPAGGAGTYTLRWTISNSPCNASTNDVVLTYNAPPTTANAGSDQTLCATSATLAANTPTVGTGAWSIVSGTGGTVTTPSSPTSGFTGTAGTTYTLRWTISNSPCTASTDDVVITLTANPTTANAGPDQSICATATLAANAPSVGTGAWTVVSGPSTSTAQFSNTTSPTATFTPAGGAGTYTLRWTISNSPCTASSDDVSLTTNTAPTLTYGGTAINQGTATTVNPATGPTDNGSITSIVVQSVSPSTAPATLTVNNSTGVVTVPNNVPFGTYTVTIRATDNCGTSTDAAFTLTVNANVPTLGNYPPTMVNLSAQASVTPDAAPTNTSSLMVTASSGFNGTFYANPTTGVVNLINAQPAGTHTITVTAFGAGGSTTKTFTLTVQTGMACGTVPLFTSAANVTTVHSPLGTAVGDFNNDGKQDLVTANGSNATASIQLGDGAGGFTVMPTVSTPTNPNAVAVGDFNGDGNLDIAVSSSNNAVAIRLGNGAGGFTGSTNITTGQTTKSIALGDFNNDGRLDFVTADIGGDSATVALGNGAGGFPTVSTVSVGDGPGQVVVADFNNDGNLDFATSNQIFNNGSYGSPGTVTVRIGNGNGTFTNGPSYNVGDNPQYLAVGDFNEDGKPDLITSNEGSASLTLILGDVSNTVTPPTPTPIAVSSGPGEIRVTDLNRDGHQDLVFKRSGLENFAYLLGTGMGSFGTTVVVPVTGAGGTKLAVGDFNGDGYQDFVTAFFGTSPTFADSKLFVRLGGCNVAPTITAGGPLARQAGSAGSVDTIATVNDTETLKQNLTVTVMSAPTGISVTSLSAPDSTTGVVTATVRADCNATTGNNTVVLQVTDGNGTTATANLTVTVSAATAPTTANAGADQMFCNITTVTLAANAPSVGTGAWSVVSGPSTSTAQFSNLSNPTANFTPAGGTGTYTLRWTITGACATSTDNVALTFIVPPTTANAGPDQTLCNVTSTTMAGNAASVGTGTWTQVNGPNTATISTPNSPTTTLTGLMTGVYTFQWTIANAPCTASSDQVTVTINAAPVMTTQPTNQSATLNGTATFTAAASGTPTPTVQWQVSTDGGMNYTDLSGQISTTLTLSNITANMNGNRYRAVFTNACNTVNSNAATLTIGCVTSLTVNNTGDGADATPGNGVCETATGNGLCTLRAALQEANALTTCAPFTISFNVTLPNTIMLGSDLPTIAHPNLTITGPGANQLTVSGSSMYRPFNIGSGNYAVSLAGLTVANGRGNGGGGLINFSTGQVSLDNMTFDSNVITASSGGGGLRHASSGTLNVTGSTFLNNNSTGAGGGGINNFSTNGIVNVTNCTFSGNLANLGGGIHNQSSGTINVTNCTLVSNGGGINNNSGTVTVKNTLAVGNGTDLSGTVTASNNLTGTLAAVLLSVLGNYGGTTPTFALLPGSPAINAGTSTDAPATDQRGIARDANVDIGAFESRGFTLTVAGGNNQSGFINTLFASPLSVTVSSSHSEPVNGGQVTFTPPGSGPSATIAGNPATISSGSATSGAVTANAIIGGPYNVVASAAGATSINFALTNTNSAPSFTPALALTRQQSSPAGAAVQVGTVNDAQTAANALTVTQIAGGTATGLSVTGLVNNNGTVTAFVSASCMAVSGTVRFQVSDGNLTSTGDLQVNVTPNGVPNLSYSTPQNLLVGGTLMLNPSTAPSDNDGLAPGISVFSQGTYTGGISVTQAGVVSFTNAAPVGSHTIMIRALDSCNTPTNASFTLNVMCQSITVTPPIVTTGLLNNFYSQTFTQSGGVGQTNFSTMNSLPNGMTLAPNGVLSGTPTQGGTFPLVVTATDANGCTGMASYTLNISTCPTLGLTQTSLTVTAGATYNQALTPSAGTAPFSFSLVSGTLPTGLSLSSAGVLAGVAAQIGTFNLTVRIADANSCSGNAPLTLVVVCPTLTVNPAQSALPGGTAGVAYNQSFTQTGAFGNAAAYSLSAGSLPAGLTLSPSGTLSGTPTQTGTFNFTVKATDTLTCMGTRAYTLVIACPTLAINPASLPSAQMGVAYSQTLTGANGIAPYSFSLANGSSLPAGLTLATNGTLSGTPSAPGTANFTVQVTDANGCSGTRSYTLNIQCPVITLNPSSLPQAQAGIAYNQSLTASGGVGPYTIAPVNGSTLPPGLTLTNGVLSGTPTQTGTFSFTLNITDTGLSAQSCTGTRTYSLTVACPTITLNPTTLPQAETGNSYNQTLTASPAGTTYSFAVTTGALPSGLTLASNGTLSGTPTAAGTFSFTVTATGWTNGQPSCTGTRSYSLTVVAICPTISVTPASLTNATVGTAYNQTLTASGGTGPYSFAVTTGSLPTGLTLSSAGLLSGTPLTTGTFSFAVTVTAAGNCTGTKNYSLTVVCPTLTLSPSTLPNTTAGNAYNQTVAASPSGTYTYSIVTGSLPPGFNLNASSGALTGQATATGTYSFSIKAERGAGCNTTKSYTIVVSCPTITVNPASLANGNVGTAYSQTLSATPAGNYSFAISAGSLPGGLSLSTAGVLSGTPTTSGTFNFTVRATAFGNCIGTRTYAVTIAAACATITLASLPTTGTLGANYYGDLSGTTPAGSYTYSVTSGTLPPGLALDNFFGALSGTLTQTGTFNFTLQATLANGCTGTQSYTVTIQAANGGAAARAELADYDGDGQADATLWQAATGRWDIQPSRAGATPFSVTWGAAGDLTLLGDYDGDGKTDLAVFRPRTATWHIRYSSETSAAVSDELRGERWGQAADLPVPGDYDGDGKTDRAVFRPATGEWLIQRSRDGQSLTLNWGTPAAAEMPVPGDYDGDGQTDLAVFQRATGTWRVQLSGTGKTLIQSWGLGTDTPVAADYDGDGQTDLAVWRGATGTWYVRRSTDGAMETVVLGAAALGDRPAPGDYDGDGKADCAVWRSGETRWYLRLSSAARPRLATQGQTDATPVSQLPQR